MKHNPQEIITHFASCYEAEIPVYFAGGHEWSDGTLYQMDIEGKSHVLKILPGENEHSFDTVHERMAFAGFAAEHGVQTIKPLLSRNKNYVEQAQHEDKGYLAVCWEFIPGKALEDSDPNHLTDFYLSWGALLGKLHRLAQMYPTWKESTAKDSYGKAMISRKMEYDVFYNWLQDDEVKAAWHRLAIELDAYPVRRDNFGFVHNDAHSGNILHNESGLVLLDFDVANFQWFALDLAICINSEYARILHHSGHKAKAPFLHKLFLEPFMKGYNSENTLIDDDLHSIGKFIHYRHFLMFAVFYNQIKENAPKYLEIMKGELLSGESYIRKETEDFFT